MLERSLGPRIRQVVDWYDSLTDLERVKYGILAMLFLLACSGYLLGLGSTILVRRVEAESAQLAEKALTPGSFSLSQPTTEGGATATPTPTASSDSPLLTAPGITEVPLVPRVLPAEPVPVIPSPGKPRNLEVASPQPSTVPRGTPTAVRTGTPGLIGTPALTPTRPTGGSTPSFATPTAVGTLAPQGTATPTPANVRPPPPLPATATPARPVGTPTPLANSRPGG